MTNSSIPFSTITTVTTIPNTTISPEQLTKSHNHHLENTTIIPKMSPPGVRCSPEPQSIGLSVPQQAVGLHTGPCGRSHQVYTIENILAHKSTGSIQPRLSDLDAQEGQSIGINSLGISFN